MRNQVILRYVLKEDEGSDGTEFNRNRRSCQTSKLLTEIGISALSSSQIRARELKIHGDNEKKIVDILAINLNILSKSFYIV